MHLKRLSLSAAALLAGLGYAAAQQNLSDPAQQQRHDDAIETKSGQGGKEEPSSHLPTKSDAILVDGKLNVSGAPQDSQTVPSKFSKRNASIDALPIMAFPIDLTDAQKHRIADSVAKEAEQQISAKPADMLPATTPVVELPQEVAAEIPAVNALKAIPTPDKILLVSAPNMVVMGEILK